MEMKVSSRKRGPLSSDVTEEPEETGFSEGEDEDDDRNHKHRRREGNSQSMEGDSLNRGSARTFRKRNRPFENGYSFREGDPQSGVAWKNHNDNMERDLSLRHEKRHPNQAPFSKASSDWNQRMRVNPMSGETGPARGRGREPVSWDTHGMVDAASQVIHPGYVPSGVLTGIGLPNVSNSPSIPWNGFGLYRGIPSSGIDTIHPLGLPGGLRPAIGPPLNIRMPRQRCPDFEERGFCLRGDMCPLEHGFNRIVVDDVQSLSQFNLPGSRSGSQLLGPSGQGSLPVTSGASSILGSIDGLGLNNGRYEASDVYDPDQPLWTNDNPGPAFNQSNIGKSVSFLNRNPSNNIESLEGFGDEHSLRISSTRGSQSLPSWGRICGTNHRTGAEETIHSVETSSTFERGIKKEEELNTNLTDGPHQGKWTNAAENKPPVEGSSFKHHDNSVHNIWKPSQKAQRTLFVSGIPLKDNKREALLLHFKKFGEVISIHIPMQSERAFVQFSKRQEAEAALKAPDAVMGNRFIKLLWANRDNMPDATISGSNTVPITPHGVALTAGLPLDKRKEISNSATDKDGNAHASGSQDFVRDRPKPTIASSGPPPQQKKLDSLGILKEELQKKQEILEQKQSEFRQQLDKLQKKAAGSNDVALSESPKTLKVQTPLVHGKPKTAKNSPRNFIKTGSTISTGPKVVAHTSTSNPTASVQEPVTPIRPLPSPWGPVGTNRFKLDNRPTAFKVGPPLPAGIANVAALKEHFSTFGDLSSVELDEPKHQENNDGSLQSLDVSACVYFTTRRTAEKAFLHGKSWQGHMMQFKWLIPSNNAAKEGHIASGNLLCAPKTIPGATGNENVEATSTTEAPKSVASECGEPGHPMNEGDAESLEQNGDPKSASACSSFEKQHSPSS